jgi:hypothetical protein
MTLIWTATFGKIYILALDSIGETNVASFVKKALKKNQKANY